MTKKKAADAARRKVAADILATYLQLDGRYSRMPEWMTAQLVDAVYTGLHEAERLLRIAVADALGLRFGAAPATIRVAGAAYQVAIEEYCETAAGTRNEVSIRKVAAGRRRSGEG